MLVLTFPGGGDPVFEMKAETIHAVILLASAERTAD